MGLGIVHTNKYLSLATSALVSFGCVASISTSALAAEPRVTIKPVGDLLVRYENDYNRTGKDDRERMRVIARGGVKVGFGANWSTTLRVSTGVQDQQNVPAFTAYKFTDHAQPPSNLYLSQAYLQYKDSNTQWQFGKLPIKLIAETATFWDKDLKPAGIALQHKFDGMTLNSFYVRGMDGSSPESGYMAIAQFAWQGKWDTWQWQAVPWLTWYQGDNHCVKACRDTEYDVTTVRFSGHIKQGEWHLGIDTGYAVSLDNEVPDDYDDQRLSAAVVVKYGKLKNAGDLQYYLRARHVERFGAVAEFAQNTSSSLHTTNMRTLEGGIKYNILPNWWIETYLSRAESIHIADLSGTRFRIHSRYTLK